MCRALPVPMKQFCPSNFMANLWVPILLAYFILVNLSLAATAYLLLLIYSYFAFLWRRENPSTSSVKDLPVLFLLAVLWHVPLIPYYRIQFQPVYVYAFSFVAAVTEEVFFRGFLLYRLGLPLQALVFMYSHLNVTDPVFLVNTALLAPHYFSFGFSAGLIAEKKGFMASSVLHVGYNLMGINLLLGFDVVKVAMLFAADLMIIAILLFFLHFNLIK